METITQTRFIQTFREKGITLFTFSDLEAIFGLRSKATTKLLVSRLFKSGVISHLVKGKYLFLLGRTQVSDYQIANYLTVPSYISLETAMSYYSIIDQFPFQITSVTPMKTKLVTTGEKTYSYSRISPKLYFDYEKIENGVLMATKLKAVYDYLYLAFKGARGTNNIDLINFGRSTITKKQLRDYIDRVKIKNNKFIQFCKNNGIYD
ncbi:MAG: hypothetical protein AAB838_01435 [Patescibacteria group bacterium]